MDEIYDEDELNFATGSITASILRGGGVESFQLCETPPLSESNSAGSAALIDDAAAETESAASPSARSQAASTRGQSRSSQGSPSPASDRSYSSFSDHSHRSEEYDSFDSGRGDAQGLPAASSPRSSNPSQRLDAGISEESRINESDLVASSYNSEFYKDSDESSSSGRPSREPERRFQGPCDAASSDYESDGWLPPRDGPRIPSSSAGSSEPWVEEDDGSSIGPNSRGHDGEEEPLLIIQAACKSFCSRMAVAALAARDAAADLQAARQQPPRQQAGVAATTVDLGPVRHADSGCQTSMDLSPEEFLVNVRMPVKKQGCRFMRDAGIQTEEEQVLPKDEQQQDVEASPDDADGAHRLLSSGESAEPGVPSASAEHSWEAIPRVGTTGSAVTAVAATSSRVARAARIYGLPLPAPGGGLTPTHSQSARGPSQRSTRSFMTDGVPDAAWLQRRPDVPGSCGATGSSWMSPREHTPSRRSSTPRRRKEHVVHQDFLVRSMTSHSSEQGMSRSPLTGSLLREDSSVSAWMPNAPWEKIVQASLEGRASIGSGTRKKVSPLSCQVLPPRGPPSQAAVLSLALRPTWKSVTEKSN